MGRPDRGESKCKSMNWAWGRNRRRIVGTKHAMSKRQGHKAQGPEGRWPITQALSQEGTHTSRSAHTALVCAYGPRENIHNVLF